MSVNRRTVLKSTFLAGALASIHFSTLSPARAATAEAFAASRQQWVHYLVGENLDRADPVIAAKLDAMAVAARSAMAGYVTTPTRTGLWADLPLSARQTNADSARVSTTARRLRSIALAWAAGSLGPDAGAALQMVADGVAWLTRDVFSTSGVRFGNWYDWDVSLPQALNDTLVLTYPAIDPALVQTVVAAERLFTPSIPQAGTQAAAANRVLYCDSFCGRAILAGDAAELASAKDNLAPVLANAKPYGGPVGLVNGDKDEAAFFSNDGFYPDGSFIQHGQFPYVGGYGASLLSSITAIAARTTGTSWSPDISIVQGWFKGSFEPWLWRGLVMDTVRGRQLATVAGDQSTGVAFIGGMLNLLPSVSSESRRYLETVIKAELGYRGTQPTEGLGLRESAAALAIIRNAAITARPAPEFTHVFGPMDRVLHRRAEWSVAYAMHSLRMADYETGNNENLRGWYTSDAATYLYTSDREQYDDGYWCTVDPYRLPGTTVDPVPRAATPVPWRAEYHNPSLYAGGLSAGTWGSAAIDLKAKAPSSMHGRFSRFFFDDFYLCLGAGISVASGRSAETTVENRRVTATSSGPLVIDGLPGPRIGESRTVNGAKWAHIGGVGGYVLLDAPDMLAMRENRSGRLSDISGTVTGSTASQVRTGEYLTLALQHRQGATSSSYAYAVLPNADQQATNDYSSRPDARIVTNTPAVQAVRHERSGRFSAAFFEAGAASIVAADSPCIVAVEESTRQIAVHVSDPTQALSRVQIRLGVPGMGPVEDNPGVSVASRGEVTVVTVDVSGLAGATVSAVLDWQPPKASDLTSMTAKAADAHFEPATASSLHKKAGRFAGAMNSNRLAAARLELRAFQDELDAWLVQNHDADASVRDLSDLASRLVVQTSS
ncbi:polysaccharide lyase family 8 super-sandwich domain-containing protein [Arthrobacter sp. 18067]|uniref:polysaccharide lyase family 8 super-sandwich domain-containing protein n=1 Tax=Arthrobacter sp. 18067 TaxID=2681413 RepID=UPI001359D130|nr:polysaccharide lyase family 8 super-sandwich domain-containing protein [Arthrobacter sp. 18067]